MEEERGVGVAVEVVHHHSLVLAVAAKVVLAEVAAKVVLAEVAAKVVLATSASTTFAATSASTTFAAEVAAKVAAKERQVTVHLPHFAQNVLRDVVHAVNVAG